MMKQHLNHIYHKYFPEIMTGILFSLLIITGLLVFGIYNGSHQRKTMNVQTNLKLDSIKTKQAVMQSILSKKSDSIQISLVTKLDSINHK